MTQLCRNLDLVRVGGVTRLAVGVLLRTAPSRTRASSKPFPVTDHGAEASYSLDGSGCRGLQIVGSRLSVRWGEDAEDGGIDHAWPVGGRESAGVDLHDGGMEEGVEGCDEPATDRSVRKSPAA